MLSVTKPGLVLTGVGSAIPSTCLNNHQLSHIVDTSDEWISTRTGISSRRLLDNDASLTTLATQAAQKALSMAELSPTKLDLIILATSTPDDLFGSAGKIQAELGASQALAFDLTAACSGFVVALITAAQFIRTGVYRNVLLIGADALSRWLDWEDRRTCVLFGDGAGAVVLQANECDRLLGFALCTDGRLNHCINLSYDSVGKTLVDQIDVGQGNYRQLTMDGKLVYRFVVEQVPEIIDKALYYAGMSIDRVDWLLLHQANKRIIDAVAKRLEFPEEKTINNLAEYGNTSAASIPLALDESVRQGKICSGDIVAIAGFGAGLTWGAAIIQWDR
ncbi:MAG: beta-ketoacyl-ACP synthase 3 [Cyanobacteria bacterium P01_D01_bin.50]